MHCVHLCKRDEETQDSGLMVEHVPAIHEILGSILNTAERKESFIMKSIILYKQKMLILKHPINWEKQK